MRDTPFQRWPTIDRLFEQALALDEQDRSRFVDHACADPELRRELHALLEAEKRSEALFDPAGVLDAIPDLAGGTRGPVTDTETLPFSVGSYRLLEVLGRGGAATVFRAERADGEFKKNVAFKLLRPTVLSDRFWPACGTRTWRTCWTVE
jgi:serine/threonine protein kinase